MATLMTDFMAGYQNIMVNRSDPRTTNWFMMSSPWPTVIICFSYILIVTKIGPRFMKYRKPFEIKNALILYNIIQVFVSTWLFYQVSAYGWFSNYNFSCQPVDYSNSPDAVWMAHICYWYLMSKYSELLDTFFFVLRKKNNQVTTLHVIHHSIMPVSTWIGVKFFPGGQASFFGLLNTFVHIIMYSYYFLAALGPWIQPFLWWKQYLTQLQLVQFILIITHSVQTLFVNCDISQGLMYYIMAHGLLFLVLFTHFYYNSYITRTNKDKNNLSTSINGLETNKENFNKQSNTATKEELRYRRRH